LPVGKLNRKSTGPPGKTLRKKEINPEEGEKREECGKKSEGRMQLIMIDDAPQETRQRKR